MPFRYQRKKGLGTHRFRLGGAMIVVKSGDTVTCDPSDLKDNLSQYDCLDAEGRIQAAAKPTARLPELVPAEQKNLFNVVNPDFPDRPLNEKPLRKKAAVEFMDSFDLKAEADAKNDDAEQNLQLGDSSAGE